MTAESGGGQSDPAGQHVEARDSATVHAPFQVGRDYIAVQHLHVHPAAGVGTGCGRPGLAAGAAAMLEGLLADFDPPALLEGLLVRVRRTRWVSVVGPAGSGKSVLLSGLACPGRCVGLVPEGLVHALAYLDATTTTVSLAQELAVQLHATLPGYRAAAEAHQQSCGAGWFEQDSFARDVTGPLARLTDGMVCLVLDGVDQLRGAAAQQVQQALCGLVQDPGLEHVRLVVSARTAEAWMPDGSRLLVPEPDPNVLSRYLQGRRVPPESAVPLAGLCVRGDSAWLLARLIGDTYQSLSGRERQDLMIQLGDPGSRPAALTGLYDRLLAVVGAQDPAAWAKQFRPVLTPLTAAGVGPVVPLQLLAAVSGLFGGPDGLAEVREMLDRLGRLVVRAAVGTDRELAGLFHPTLVEHLAEHAAQRVDVVQGRRVLVEQIERLVPVTGLYMDNPLYRWAEEAEAEHLWQLGLISRALTSITRRPLATPRQNLERWGRWHTRVRTARGPSHPDTLLTRSKVAHWTGEVGEPVEALRLFRELLPDRVRVLGAAHPSTLATRNDIAVCTGEVGEPAEALRLLRELLPEQVRVLSVGQPSTLAIRSNIAAWTGEVGEPAEALRLLRELLPDQVRVLGAAHPDTLATRSNIAAWTGEVGEPVEALRLLRELLPDRVRVLGAAHPSTLATRSNLAFWTGEVGESAEALRLFRELLPEQVRVLGAAHPDTLSVQRRIALGRGGRPGQAR